MTSARPFPNSRLVLRSTLTALRTTTVAGLAAWTIIALQSPTHDWVYAGQAVWSMRAYLGVIFVGSLVWDYCALRRISTRHD